MSIRVNSNGQGVQVVPRRTRRLVHTETLMMVTWDFEDGPWAQPEPLHAHAHEQVTYLVEGEAVFFLGEEQQHLRPGDMVAVPANVPHGAQPLTPRVRLVDAFTPLRQEFLSAP